MHSAVTRLLQPAQTFTRIMRKIQLAQFAVIHDVDANLRLMLNNLFDRRRQPLEYSSRRVGPASKSSCKSSGRGAVPAWDTRIRD